MLILYQFILRFDIVGVRRGRFFLDFKLDFGSPFQTLGISFTCFFAFCLGPLLHLLDCLDFLRLVWLSKDLLGPLARHQFVMQLDVVKGSWG